MERWESFARADAASYIDPTLSRGASVEEFIAGGRAVVERVLEWVGEAAPGDHALEIGCGIGRNTVHLARHFERVDGVDVSETMVREAVARGLPENVRLHATSGRDLAPFEDGSFGFVFSHLVFQHVADNAVLAGYLREIARVLRKAGVAALQFDTRPASSLTKVVQALPDPLLPRIRRRGIRRHRRSAGSIRGLGQAAGLSLVRELDPDSAEHWFWWQGG